MSARVHLFEKNRGENNKKSANRPENVKTDAPTEDKDRESTNRAQVHCDYTSSAFLKNTAHRHVSKRRQNARKTQRNGGITPKKHLDTTHRRISDRIPNVSRETAKKQAKPAFLNARNKETALRYPNISSSEHPKHYLSARSITLCRRALTALCRYIQSTLG